MDDRGPHGALIPTYRRSTRVSRDVSTSPSYCRSFRLAPAPRPLILPLFRLHLLCPSGIDGRSAFPVVIKISNLETVISCSPEGGGQGYGVLGVAGDMTFRRALERTEALLRVLRA